MSKRIKVKSQQGYTVRELSSGNFQFRVANGSSKPTTRSFKDYKAGERWARPIATLHKDGKYAVHKLAAETTLGTALERYALEVSALKKGDRQERSRIRALLSLPIASKTLLELSTRDFASLKTEWLTTVGPNGVKKLSAATVNRYIALLHHLFEIARTEWGYETIHNPVSDVRRPTEADGRDRRVARDEYANILRYAKSHLRNPYWIHFFRFSIRCPQRKSELLARTWADVDLKEGRLKVANGKTGPRYAPLLEGAVKTLAQMKNQFSPRSTDKIFPMSSNAADLIWKQVKKDLEIHNLHWHDLRHEGCSQASTLLGFDIAMLQKVSGHKSISQLLRYVNNSMHDVHAAIRRKKAERAAGNRKAISTGPGEHLTTDFASVLAQQFIKQLTGQMGRVEPGNLNVATLEANSHLIALLQGLQGAANQTATN